MSPELESRIISDRRIWSKSLVLATIGLLVTFVVAAGYYIYYIQINTPDATSLPPLENSGISESPDADWPMLVGELVFTTNTLEDQTRLPRVFEYSFTNDTQGVLVDLPLYAYRPLSDGSILTIAYFEETEDPDGWQPSVVNIESGIITTLPGANLYNETNLSSSLDGRYYAYSAQKSSSYSNLLSDWSVFIYRNDGELLIEIPAADSPQVSPDGQYVYYLQNDAVYRYAIASSSTEALVTKYSNFSRFDSIVVSPNNNNLLLSIPTRSALVYFDIANEGLVEISRLVKEDHWFHSPIFSPDGLFYAVVTSDIESDKENRLSSIEIYPLSFAESVKTISLTEFDSRNLKIEAWTDTQLEVNSSFSEDYELSN